MCALIQAGPNNPDTKGAALTAQRLGEALANSGQHERATSVFGRAVAAGEVAFGQESAEVVASLTSLGLSLSNQVRQGPNRARPFCMSGVAPPVV